MSSPYINISFPLSDDTEKNFLFKRTKTTMDAIKSNLMLLIMTPKGSRYFMRDYGTNVIKYIFEPNDEITQTDVIDEIKNSVRKYMPKITINNVVFPDTIENKENNRLELNIYFTYNDDYYSETDYLTIIF